MYQRWIDAPGLFKGVREFTNFYSELLLIDRGGDGLPLAFDQDLLSPLASSFQIICLGGNIFVSQVKYLLSRDNISAVAVGNFLNYSELANLNFIDDSSRYSFETLIMVKLVKVP